MEPVQINKMKNKKAQMEMPIQEEPIKKKSKALLWILLILLIIGVGVGIWFYLSNISGGAPLSLPKIGGNSIPSPPALPSG